MYRARGAIVLVGRKYSAIWAERSGWPTKLGGPTAWSGTPVAWPTAAWKTKPSDAPCGSRLASLTKTVGDSHDDWFGGSLTAPERVPNSPCRGQYGKRNGKGDLAAVNRAVSLPPKFTASTLR
jgi:hypothetical protein